MLLFPGITLVLLVGGWLAFYVYERGFTKKWRGFVRNEFRERGVELDFSKLTVDPLQGLVARDVRIFDSRARAVQLATISGIKLDADLIKLLGRTSFINSIDLDDVSLSIPLVPEGDDGEAERYDGDETLSVHHLSAKAFFSPGRVEVREGG